VNCDRVCFWSAMGSFPPGGYFPNASRTANPGADFDRARQRGNR
jgi:hypothetical protein